MTRPTSSSAAASPTVTMSQAKGMRSRARSPWSHRRGAHAALSASARRGGEHIAAMGVVAEHVEARAGRRQQHDVAGPRGRAAAAATASGIEAAHSHAADAGERRARLPCASRPISTAWRTLPRKACAQRREILSLAIAAGDQHQRPGHARDGGDRRADVGALGIIDVAHAGDVGDPLRAVRQPGECLAARAASPAAASRPPRPAPAQPAHWRRCGAPGSSAAPPSSSGSPLRASQVAPPRSTRA